MNNYIALELTEFQKKTNGYLTMFNYRLANYCVKAEPTAMLPITVVLAGKEYNFLMITPSMSIPRTRTTYRPSSTVSSTCIQSLRWK